MLCFREKILTDLEKKFPMVFFRQGVRTVFFRQCQNCVLPSGCKYVKSISQCVGILPDLNWNSTDTTNSVADPGFLSCANLKRCTKL